MIVRQFNSAQKPWRPGVYTVCQSWPRSLGEVRTDKELQECVFLHMCVFALLWNLCFMQSAVLQCVSSGLAFGYKGLGWNNILLLKVGQRQKQVDCEYYIILLQEKVGTGYIFYITNKGQTCTLFLDFAPKLEITQACKSWGYNS